MLRQKWKGNARTLILKTEPPITKSCVQGFDGLITQGPLVGSRSPRFGLGHTQNRPRIYWSGSSRIIHAPPQRHHDRLSNPPARVGCCAGARAQARCPLYLPKAGVCANPLGSCRFKSKIYVTNKRRYLYCILVPTRSLSQ